MRGKQAKKRNIKPDQKYNSKVVSKLINYVMLDGKKALATKNVYLALEEVQAKTKTKGIEGLEKALENLKPHTEVRSKRIGGSNFQVPVPVSGF
jgi:small subunit ribosomal protein S7